MVLDRETRRAKQGQGAQTTLQADSALQIIAKKLVASPTQRPSQSSSSPIQTPLKSHRYSPYGRNDGDSRDSFVTEVQQLRQLIQTQAQTISTLQASVQALSQRVEVLERHMKVEMPSVVAQEVQKQVPHVPHEALVKEIEKQVADVQQVAERLDQARRANNVIIWGLDERPNEDTASTVHDLFSAKLGLHWIPLNRVTRFGLSQDSKPRPVVCTVQNGDDCQALLRAKLKLRGTTVYINPDLTPLQQRQRREHLDRVRSATMGSSVPKNVKLMDTGTS